MRKVQDNIFGTPKSQYTALWDFNFKIWHISFLAAVFKDTPHIDRVLHFTALEGCYEFTIALHMRVMALKSFDTQRDGISAAAI
jgi:hypothetical protein